MARLVTDLEHRGLAQERFLALRAELLIFPLGDLILVPSEMETSLAGELGLQDS